MSALYNFLQEYESNIVPKLKAIDVFLKTETFPIKKEDVADILYMDIKYIEKIMKKLRIKNIYISDFMQIMKNGESYICKLYQRELEIGSPLTYTHSQIAYIYNLDKYEVENACKKLKIKEITSFVMPLVFEKVVIK